MSAASFSIQVASAGTINDLPCPIVAQHVAKYGFPFVVTSVDKIRAQCRVEKAYSARLCERERCAKSLIYINRRILACFVL